eukprot:m.29728 g.29728  ORF g.29728 m.29728 type:complete len:212 (+) comp9200_c0_seq2:80-715(+)
MQEARPISLERTLKTNQGLGVLDIVFDEVQEEDINVLFQNFYVHSLSILYRTRPDAPFALAAANVALMGSPHHEDGGQDSVCLRLVRGGLESAGKDGRQVVSEMDRAHSITKWTCEDSLGSATRTPMPCSQITTPAINVHVAAGTPFHSLRIVLFQPSSQWLRFGIVNFECYAATPQRRQPSPPLPFTHVPPVDHMMHLFREATKLSANAQ